MEHSEMTYTAAQFEREMTRIEIQANRWFTISMFLLCLLFTSYAGIVLYLLFR